MKHTCYHVLSDLHDEFLNTPDEVIVNTEKWINEGDAHLKIFRLSTEEVEPDEIILDEEIISLDDISKN